MSQKSSPRSPRTPRSKSPSCDDVEDAEQQNIEDIQRAVDEELKSADRILSEARNSIIGSRGRTTPSRSSHQPSAASQKASRIPTPEFSRSYTAQLAHDDDPVDDYCPEDTEPAKYTPSISPQRGQSGTRSASMSGKISSVTFGNKSSVRYAEDTAASYPGVNQSTRDMTTSAVRMNSYNDAAISNPRLGPSYQDAAVSNMRMGPSYNDAAISNMRMGPSYDDAAVSNMRMSGYTESAASSMRMGQSYTSAAPSRTSRRDMNTSGMGISYNDADTSAMTFRVPSLSQGANCSPNCKRFMKEIADADPFTSTPLPSKEAFRPQTQDTTVTVRPAPCRRTPSPVGYPEPQMGPADKGHHGHHQPAPRERSPKFERQPAPVFDATGHAGHHHHHHGEGSSSPFERDEKVVSALDHLSQIRKTPSYYRCGLSQGTDFLKFCAPKPKDFGKVERPGRFPEIPCLREEELDDLIKCENQDVDSVYYVMADERKTYKKPCPKQQRAQMSVKALVQAHAAQPCSQKGVDYSPLDHPDPEDISPEVAAAMMFAQEQGIKMEECPNDTITHLFPEEPKSSFPEKIPASSISVVDRSSKDTEEIIERSASVPSEGVSDSAYTRTMKGKEDMGPQKSLDIDFAIGQSKREYVLVAEKPQRVNKVQYRGNTPPWFPGFLSAFPDDEGLKIVNSPSGLFHKAWVHSNPGNMPTSDVIVLD